MARNAGATREEVEAIIGKYRQSGLTRQEYCKREGVTVYMLDYYQRRLYKLREREAAAAKRQAVPSAAGGDRREHALPAQQLQQQQQRRTPRIARVEIQTKTSRTTAAAAAAEGFAMTLPNGRRIEVASWGFRNEDLTRLIQVAERA